MKNRNFQILKDYNSAGHGAVYNAAGHIGTAQ